MGVTYHAHARFLDATNSKVTVAAPVDPGTPHAPWWYDWIAANARALRSAGFSAIMFPPVCKTQSGHFPSGDGYGVFDQYDLGSKLQSGSIETRFGTREQLQRSIAIARACGLDVYIDVVMHQLNGGANGIYTYVGANGAPGQGRFPKHPGCFRGDPPRRPQDPVPEPFFDFSFGDELVYINCDPPNYTTDGMLAFGDWLTRSLDVQGYRVDDTKGTAVAFVHRWMSSASMASKFCVSEYFDGNPETLRWWVHDSGMQGRSSVFDFALHFTLQQMCDDPSFDMLRLNGAGYSARDPYNAVTFVDNPDTDLSPGEQIASNKLLAYAFILTTEGYPFVYHKDYSQDPGCYGLKPWIDNLVWIHENLANGPTTTRWNDSKTFVIERLSAPGLLTALSTDVWNSRTITCQTAFGAFAHLHDYTGKHPDIWTDGSGLATFTVPSNAFGSGRSYLCFSLAGRDQAFTLQEQPTTQTFFGASDLDIAPIPAAGAVRAGRIWCAARKEMRLALRLMHLHANRRFQLDVLGPNGAMLASQAFQGATHEVKLSTVSSGWHEIRVSGAPLPAATPLPFELEVSYTATQDL